MALRQRAVPLCLLRMITVCFVLTLITANLYGLAPETNLTAGEPTLILTPEGYEHVAFIAQLAKALGIKFEDLLNAFISTGIPEHQVNALLGSLKYLWQSKILSSRSLQHWESSPLSAKVSALLTLAWATEHQHLWVALAKGPLDPYWGSIRLDSLIAQTDRPPERVLQRLQDAFDLAEFSTEIFFEHPLLRNLPQTPTNQMKKLAASTHGWNDPAMLETLSLVFLNPYFSEQLSHLIEQNSAVPGMVSILQRLVQIVPGKSETYQDNAGTVYELAHLQHSFVGKGYEVIDVETRLRFRGAELTEADVAAVRVIEGERRLFLGEVKTIDLARKEVGFPLNAILTGEHDQHLFLANIEGRFPHALQRGDRANFSNPVHQVLRDLWIQSEVIWKAERFLEARDAGVLIPLMAQGRAQRFGGIVFSIFAGNDPLLEGQIREAARKLTARHEGISISVDFVPTNRLASNRNHPNRAKYSFSPDQWQDLQESFALRRAREDLQRFQRQIQRETGQILGVEALHILLGKASGDRTGLLRLLATEGFKEIERWPDGHLASRIRGKDPDRPASEGRPALGITLETSAAGTSPLGPYVKLDGPVPEGVPVAMEMTVGWELLPHDAEESKIWWELSAEIAELLKKRVRALSEEEWPGNSAEVALHTEDGQILLRAAFLGEEQEEQRGLLFVPAVLIVEEILISLARRGSNQANAALLLAVFQQRNHIPRRNIATLRMALEKGEAHEALRIELSQHLEKKLLAYDAYWREVSPSLKERFGKQHQRLTQAVLDQRDLLKSPSITQPIVRRSHKEIVGQMRALRRAIEGAKDNANKTASLDVASPAKKEREPTRSSTLPEDSIKPALNQKEQTALRDDLQFVENTMQIIHELLKASALLAADQTSAPVALDSNTLSLLRQNLSQATLADLESSSTQTLEKGLATIRSHLVQVIGLALDAGYPKTIEGRPDHAAAGKHATAVSKGRVGKFKKELAALKGAWPGPRVFQKIYARLQDRISKESNEDKEEASVLYLEAFLRLWQVDLSTLLSDELEVRDIPTFRALLDRLDDLSIAFRQKAVQARWKREGFRPAEQELITGWMNKVIALFRSLSARTPYPLEGVGRPAYVSRFWNELNALEQMLGNGHYEDLFKQKEKVLIAFNYLRTDLHDDVQRIIRPLMGRVRTLELPGLDEGLDPAKAPDAEARLMHAFGLIKDRVDELSKLDLEELKTRFAGQDFRVDRRSNVTGRLVTDRLAEWLALWGGSNLEVIREQKGNLVTYKYDLVDDLMVKELKDDLEKINRFLAGQIPDPFPGLPRPSDANSETRATSLTDSGL